MQLLYNTFNIKVAAAGSGIRDMQRNKLSVRSSTRFEDIITVKP